MGEDRIARTAEAALSGLEYLRTETGEAIPLAWSHEHVRGIVAIEVYPAVTLKVHSLPCDGYKKNADDGHKRAREKILSGLLGEMTIPAECRETAGANADGLDALVCFLTAADFLNDPTPANWPSRLCLRGCGTNSITTTTSRLQATYTDHKCRRPYTSCWMPYDDSVSAARR